MRYRKKPVVIEAWQFTGQDRWEWPDWLKGHPTVFYKLDYGTMEELMKVKTIHIPTLEGEMTAQRGDWIIRGIAGEIYPCKPDIFAATYEPFAEPISPPPGPLGLSPTTHQEEGRG